MSWGRSVIGLFLSGGTAGVPSLPWRGRQVVSAGPGGRVAVVRRLAGVGGRPGRRPPTRPQLFL